MFIVRPRGITNQREVGELENKLNKDQAKDSSAIKEAVDKVAQQIALSLSGWCGAKK